MSELWVIMPAYNEQAAVAETIREWLPVLRANCDDFTFCALNDGSRDDTLRVLERLQREVPELCVIDKPNSGHGQTCLEGYRRALAGGARFVFQIDSDGQCDPAFFPAFWRTRAGAGAVYGYRRKREDGNLRAAMSRVVSVVGWLGFGVWARDPNVPYRLMSRTAVESVVERVPPDFALANILVCLLQEETSSVTWLDIVFRKRSAGMPSVRALAFAKRGLDLYRQLSKVRQAGPSSANQFPK